MVTKEQEQITKGSRVYINNSGSLFRGKIGKVTDGPSREFGMYTVVFDTPRENCYQSYFMLRELSLDDTDGRTE